jgi:hypothetical protein
MNLDFCMKFVQERSLRIDITLERQQFWFHFDDSNAIFSMSDMSKGHFQC